MRSDQSANHRRDTGGKMELYSTGYCRVRGMQLKISTRDEEEEEEKHQVYCYHQYINLDTADENHFDRILGRPNLGPTDDGGFFEKGESGRERKEMKRVGVRCYSRESKGDQGTDNNGSV